MSQVNVSGTEEKRITYIDIARGIGLICVIFGHLRTLYLSYWIYTFHMPLFFFLSGMVFSEDKYKIKDFIFKKARTLLIPFFSLGFIIFLFYCIVNCILSPKYGPYGSSIDMLNGFLIQKHYWTVWFLTCLFFVEIFYYFVNKFAKNKLVIMSFFSIIVAIVGFALYRMGCDGIPWNIDIALVAQLFYHLGYTFKKTENIRTSMFEQSKIKKNLMIVIFLVANLGISKLNIKLTGKSMDMSIGLYGNEFLAVMSAICGIFFILLISNEIGKSGIKLLTNSLKYLGQNTMIIFTLHSRVLIVLFGYIYEELKLFQSTALISSLVYSCITFIMILIILVPITELLKKTKISWIFGV